MNQEIDGLFKMRLKGVPFLFLGATIFRSLKGTTTKTWTVHVGPFVVGLNRRQKS